MTINYLPFIIRLNPLVRRILRSRLHWLLSKGVMLVTIRGRRSGRRYSTPVGYHSMDGQLVVMVADAANRGWWRNFIEPWPLELKLRGRDITAEGVVVPGDSDEFRRCAEIAFRNVPRTAGLFGIEFNADAGLSGEQQQRLADYAAIVKITPNL